MEKGCGYGIMVPRWNLMKFMHLADLHIGKRLLEASLLEDQREILQKIVEIARNEAVDAVLIAGDVYDKSVPGQDAVELADEFLFNLAGTGAHVFVMSGNHDSPQRIAFNNRLMDSRVHMSPVYSGNVGPVVLNDSYGEVAVYLLPFIKPSMVKDFLEDSVEGCTYDQALRIAVRKMAVPFGERRNVLVAHQFVAGSSRCDSEEHFSVGDVDNINPEVFDGFDYVALGHLHRPQKVSRETMRYAGSPLKYSFSEIDDRKSVPIVSLNQKDDVLIKLIPLESRRRMVHFRGLFSEMMRQEHTEDWVYVTLTDEEDVPDSLNLLRTVFPNLLKLDMDNSRTRALGVWGSGDDVQGVDALSPMDVVGKLFEMQNGKGLDESQQACLGTLVAEIWGQEE